MKKQIHTLNARYLDDIYGVIAVEHDGYYLCIRVQYHVGLMFQHSIKGMIEEKLSNDKVFRKGFMQGDPVRVFKK